MVPKNDPLYAVVGVYNAIKLHGDMLENVMFYGQGAGKEATASAVVSDIQDCVRRLGSHREILWSKEQKELGDIMEYPFRFLVRVEDGDAEKLASFQAALGDADRLDAPEGVSGEAAYLTKPMTENALQAAVQAADVNVISRIRLSW